MSTNKKASELLEESAAPFDAACMKVRDMERELEQLRRALDELVNEPQPLGIDRPAYQRALAALMYERKEADAVGGSRLQRLVTWHEPKGEVPDGLLLVEVDLSSGDTDVALVYIDDEDCDTLREPENGDVWTNWQWCDVDRYAHFDDILIAS